MRSLKSTRTAHFERAVGARPLRSYDLALTKPMARCVLTCGNKLISGESTTRRHRVDRDLEGSMNRLPTRINSAARVGSLQNADAAGVRVFGEGRRRAPASASDADQAPSVSRCSREDGSFALDDLEAGAARRVPEALPHRSERRGVERAGSVALDRGASWSRCGLNERREVVRRARRDHR
jgi:hypothetical protein